MSDAEKKISSEQYPAIIQSLKSPMSVFGLAMLLCNAVFAISAAFMEDINAFTYAIHTFLAIVFAFVGIAVWSPRSLYHPAELQGIEKDLNEPKHSKYILTFVILIAGFGYAGYQIATPDSHSVQCSCEQASHRQLN